MSNYSGKIVNSAEVRAARNAYMKEWRSKPENLERARAVNRASRAKRLERDAEAFRQRERERSRAYYSDPANRAHKADRQRAHAKAGLHRRRGLNLHDRHDYWVFHGGLCDFCRLPYPDPALPGAWRDSVVDHDRTHCDRKIGCNECVRAQGHRTCNVMEGVIAAAIARGLIDGFTGRLAVVLDEKPMQRWLSQR